MQICLLLCRSGLTLLRWRYKLSVPLRVFFEAGHCLSDAFLVGPGGVKRRKHLLYHHNHKNKGGLKQFKHFLTGYEVMAVSLSCMLCFAVVLQT